ncbi:MFS transporter [Serratia sp. UGAL515B_01]|uniref:MFS transporter n=1 Tax=Serratia sp. UGAL515B_01 TaxID=2986763 RepID=UPI00295464E0|nr:MFS transporter [Serratia sp. UGAL515B_01]WON77713.1 MFS transporter [Serratia sp. UGAL515B_01]
MSQHTSKSVSASVSMFESLRQRLFAVLWIATVVGNTGSFIRDVASAWLMTDLSSSPTAIAMVQAAATLPVFLLSIPAGVLADILDRRRLLIGIQCLLGITGLGLMLLSMLSQQSVTSLVAMTFLGGIGAALMGPTWQAIVPELVEKKALKNAIALNSLGINISRAIGPALGGILLASFGAAFSYGINVISCLFVVAALLWWRRQRTEQDVLTEQFSGAFRAGLRYVRVNRELHIVLLRAFLFFSLASAVWALLPLVARQMLDGNASFYGIMLGAVGLGAIGGALIMPRLRQHLSTDGLLLIVSLTIAAVMSFLSLTPPRWLAVAALLILGAGWITALTTLNGVAQAILPNWVRGRSLAVYLTVFNGAMTVGSLGWGALAEVVGIPLSLLAGAGGLVVVGLIAHLLKLPSGEADLEPSHHWPEPLTTSPIEHDRGPVLLQVEYRIDIKDRPEFLKALARLSAERRRDGAYMWGVAEDSANPELILEWFHVESWAEHMRQHRRVSKAGADVQAEVLRFNQSEQPPIVRHFLAFNHPHKGSV